MKLQQNKLHNQNKFNILLFCLIFLLCSCAKKEISKSIKIKTSESEARLLDIPIPISRSIKSAISQDTYAFITTLNSKQLINFFIGEMERFGWKFVGLNDSLKSEICQFFEKPSKYASISIRSKTSNKNEVYIFIIKK